MMPKESYLLRASEQMMIGCDGKEVTKPISDGMVYVMEEITKLMYKVHPLDAPLMYCGVKLFLDVLDRAMQEESKSLAQTLYDLLKDQNGIHINSVDVEGLMKQLLEERNGRSSGGASEG